MAITTGLCFSFKEELLLGIHDFLNDTFYAALYDSSVANLSPLTTVYTTTGEIPSGGGYSTGGILLTGATVGLGNGVAYASFNSPVWPASNITASGAMVYNASKADRAVFVLGFQSTTSSTGDFVLRFPPNFPSSALIRI